MELTLTARGAGYAAIQQCLELQNGALPLGRFARFFGMSPLAKDARSWYLGALGEIVVAENLKRLGAGWRVINAVPVGTGDSDIDRVVIGPTGIFTINTKAHANKKVWAAGQALRVNGFKHNYIRNSQHEAARASKVLSSAAGRQIDVTPLIVMVGISEFKYGARRPEVEVVTSRRIVRNLRRRRKVLTPDAVTEIADVARRRGTWHCDPVVLSDTQRHVQLRAPAGRRGRGRASAEGVVDIGDTSDHRGCRVAVCRLA